MKKKKATKKDKEFVFKITLDLDSPMMWSGKINPKIRKSKKAVWREVVMLSNQTLYGFAESIIDILDFSFDHCFGFFSNLSERSMHDSKEIYELFTDLKDEGVEYTPNAKGVKKVKISQVFKQIGKKMLFYFDYGDSWSFLVELKEIKTSDLKKTYPYLLASQGKNPEQYPLFEEEE